MNHTLKNVARYFKSIALILIEYPFRSKRKAEANKNLQKLIKGKSIIKLHVGCGARTLAGWINIDLHYHPYENYLKSFGEKYYSKEIRGTRFDFYPMDVTKEKLPFGNNSIDVIFHEDFIEHIEQRNQISFLAETLRVLKRGGVHRINTPNLLSSMRDHSDFSKGFLGVYFGEWDNHLHKNVLTPNTLQELALMVGYSKVIFNNRDESISKLIPKEFRPGPDRSVDGNIFADLIK
ncbi:MAG: hypothetical protein A2908_01655 [Candidatus Staskawiczbacteria bacterium RIFCSPLOWO2_01_FULL_38_12b]|uniref:Methyltransferase type 11 domain-containing protein n=2 Tax=Candidatus Staskawicziibacteriota TaxID=1817916 RepID=A0A1G2IEE7_9BACT|nr:MAG: hypothetical protein A3D34_00035 [Candidatus Staskawiczbacteria bacterium RIFCSPHIGHO2_02_FULL_33_16]OGZ72558.1 MAG: hypothetical protein A2908_01655 [Candidatus Staskawiczbacteria bacterium RIFCSPLOWO2_01_FULL_38_12b]